MKAKLVDSIRPGDWIYEIKSDGYRALALRGANETRVLSRAKSGKVGIAQFVLCNRESLFVQNTNFNVSPHASAKLFALLLNRDALSEIARLIHVAT
jgi:hypothetical protein